MLPLRIVVRTRTAWETMTAESYMRQDIFYTPSEFVRMGRNVLPHWEAATGLSYYKYRARIKELCEERLRGLGLPITIGLELIDWDGPDEALIPIDDDDLLLPSVASIADTFTDDINLVIWHRVTNYLGTERLENPVYGGQLDTCNWAIRKSFINRLPQVPRDDTLLKHWHAAPHLKTLFSPKAVRKPTLLELAKRCVVPSFRGLELKHPSIVHMPERHSVYYLHSASISFLSYKMAKTADPTAAIRKLPLHPVYEAANVPG